MDTENVIAYRACPDCYELVATEESPASPDSGWNEAAALSSIAALETNATLTPADGGEYDADFSWRPCEICGTGVGGQRYTLHLNPV